VALQLRAALIAAGVEPDGDVPVPAELQPALRLLR
jgi:hypothetical protein